jgi:ABC-2 type transport system permease protein/oleandomycin transport system permease protein
MAWRNLARYVRVPTLLIGVTLQPVIFVLLFAFVFGGAIGGAIQAPGVSYIDYLLPGIFVQTVIFGATQTGVGLADDLQKGVVDRFRSLPMSRSAVLAGRTLSDTVRNLFVVLLMIGLGYLIGFQFQGGLPAALGAIALVLLFGFAFSWISATIGLLIRDTESVQSIGLIWVFPLVFASSVFVPVESMPGWLAAFSQNINPITYIVDAIRSLVLGSAVEAPVWPALVWIAAIVAVFAPLSVRLYRRA